MGFGEVREVKPLVIGRRRLFMGFGEVREVKPLVIGRAPVYGFGKVL